jgi:hypothetical protein
MDSDSLELHPEDEARRRLMERIARAHEVEAQDPRELSFAARARRFLWREGKLRVLAQHTGLGGYRTGLSGGYDDTPIPSAVQAQLSLWMLRRRSQAARIISQRIGKSVKSTGPD